MPKKSVHLDDVFGISRGLPLTYTERPRIDGQLLDSLSRKKHIVIYGSSKQGKTCLRKHCLMPTDETIITCQNKWSLETLHASILKQVGYSPERSTSVTTDGRKKVKLSYGGKAGIPLVATAKVTGELEENSRHSESQILEPLDIDPRDVNDIISALHKVNFKGFLVLEDFHYLPIETQKDFSVALKAFHESSDFCFLIIGVWREENRLIVYNGDLTGRVIAIDADTWTNDDLRKVVNSGETLLNIKINEKFCDDLINKCFESVYILQEVCYRACANNGIYQTQDTCLELLKDTDPKSIIRDVVNEQTGRYKAFLFNFSEGFQPTELEMYRWLLYPVIVSSPQKLESGLRYKEIRMILEDAHPEGEGLNPGNIVQALNYVQSLQVKKEITPFVLDYDQTNSILRVVDKEFIIWLANQDKSELLEGIGLPTDRQTSFT